MSSYTTEMTKKLQEQEESIGGMVRNSQQRGISGIQAYRLHAPALCRSRVDETKIAAWIPTFQPYYIFRLSQ